MKVTIEFINDKLVARQSGGNFYTYTTPVGLATALLLGGISPAQVGWDNGPLEDKFLAIMRALMSRSSSGARMAESELLILLGRG